MSARLDGAKMRASWPSWRRRRARWRTWSLTPPGDAKSYGETSPTLIWIPRAASRPDLLRPSPRRSHSERSPIVACSRRAFPDAMRDVPLVRMTADETLDMPQELLGRAHLVLPGMARVLREDQRGPLGLVGVVRQPVRVHGKKRH